MTIEKEKNGGALTLYISGRLDTTTAPELEQTVKDGLEGIDELIFDFKELAYVSSAGLRVLLQTQKAMNSKGKMEIRNVNEAVMDVFEITGFSDILTIIK